MVGVAGGAELRDSVVEVGGECGENDGTVLAADEVEARFRLDELELGGQVCRLVGARGVSGPPPEAVPTGGEERV